MLRGFPGQLSGLGLQATQAFPWTLAAFPIRSFQAVKVRFVGFFTGWIR